MRKKLLVLAISALALFALGILVWHAQYPDDSDRKSLRYTLWKHNLYGMNLDVAADLMVGDPGRDRIAVGKTKGELRERFGYLLGPGDASPYLRTCFESSPWRDRDVLFIRKSHWMVVFDGERAANLILIKGC
jgi:hypothetical protein